jgi:hypothetical protein
MSPSLKVLILVTVLVLVLVFKLGTFPLTAYYLVRFPSMLTTGYLLFGIAYTYCT